MKIGEELGLHGLNGFLGFFGTRIVRIKWISRIFDGGCYE